MTVKEVLLEEKRPTWIEAKAILDIEFKNARSSKTKCLVIIHGYGSSGVGGTLRSRTRSYLREKLKNKSIKRFVFGENFWMYDPDSRYLINTYPDLSYYYNKRNEGITIVEI